MHSSLPNEHEGEAGTKKPKEEQIRQIREVEKGLGVEGDTGGASANASTRSLAGSRAERTTPRTSLFEGGDTSGGPPQTPLSAPSSGTPEKEEHVESAKTGVGAEKSPHMNQIHMSGPPVTAGRDYPLSSNEKKELARTLSAEGIEETTDSTPDHMMKGKARESESAPLTSGGPHSTATSPHLSSTKTSSTVISQEPAAGPTTVPVGTTTSDTTAGASSMTATQATPSTTAKPTSVGDKPVAQKSDAPPKKSKYSFFEKLKIKFEGKDSGRAKAKN